MFEREKNRVRFTFFAFILFFLLVMAKLFYVQVINRDKLMAYTNSQLIRESVVYPQRGNIYDRKGDPLAISVQTYSIFMIPESDGSHMKSIVKLLNIVPEIKTKILVKKIKKRSRYTWLVRKIKLTEKQIKKIAKLEHVFMMVEPSRLYPNNELLAQTLGFVGVDNTGLSGVEFRFDKDLRGDAKVIKYMKDAKGRPVKFEIVKKEGTAKDIVLSIDKGLQATAEKAMREAVVKFSALKGGFGVMNADTGEILAIGNYPSFDPNKLVPEDRAHRKLSFISDPFEPGSIFKTLTVISGLENGIITPNTHYYCERGKMRVGNHTIKEAETHEQFEWLSVNDILKKSSNIGVTKIAFDLSFSLLNDTLLKLSIGQKTGIEIPGESRGIYAFKKNVDQLGLSNLSFGQGVATTGIQMLASYAAIANGGYYVRPTILKVDSLNDVEKRKVFSKEVVKQVTAMLQGVVKSGGTGTNANLQHFTIAGKTGTAQKANDSGKYENYISGFIGFPINVKKNIVVFVYVDEPGGNTYYGNQVAAPVFKEIMSFALLNNREKAQREPLLADETYRDNLQSVVVADDKKRNFGVEKIPDFSGLDKISVAKLAESLGLRGGFSLCSPQI
jgi:cell division protein FtsI (penicillin-binding protein 3)